MAKSSASSTKPQQDTPPTVFNAKFTGMRPILFDRYPGDNKTKIKPEDKFYLREEDKQTIIFPALNVYSLLTAQNSDSVSSRFYGKQKRDVALGVNAFCEITGDEPDGLASVIYDANGKPWVKKDKRIRLLTHVGRLKKGALVIPNPTTRPMLLTGWNFKFKFKLLYNEFVSADTFKYMVEQGGILGFGTFRPIFGRYTVEITEIEAP